MARALSYLNESQTGISLDAAVEDQTEEIESLVNGFEVDKELEDGTLQDRNVDSDDLQDSDDRPARWQCLDLTSNSGLADQLSANLKDASKGVVVDTTLSDYAK